MTTDDYVSYPLALALKKAGFDYPCYFYYTRKDSPDDHVYSTTSEEAPIDYNRSVYAGCSMPTLAQAQKWLREVKKWHIIVEPRIWEQQVYDFKLWHYYRGYENANRGFDYLSYELALSAGIAAALELIEMKGE